MFGSEQITDLSVFAEHPHPKVGRRGDEKRIMAKKVVKTLDAESADMGAHFVDIYLDVGESN